MWWVNLPPARGPRSDTVAEDMAALGVEGFEPPEWMLEEGPEGEPDEFGVLPENWEAVEAFIACATQWRVDSRGTLLALRYADVEVVLRHRGLDAEAFDKIQIMESAARTESIRQAAARS